MFFYLYWDESDEQNASYTKVRRAVHESLETAIAQAEHDLEMGYRVLCIEESKTRLREEVSVVADEPIIGLPAVRRVHVEFARGEIVWEP